MHVRTFKSLVAAALAFSIATQPLGVNGWEWPAVGAPPVFSSNLSAEQALTAVPLSAIHSALQTHPFFSTWTSWKKAKRHLPSFRATLLMVASAGFFAAAFLIDNHYFGEQLENTPLGMILSFEIMGVGSAVAGGVLAEWIVLQRTEARVLKNWPAFLKRIARPVLFLLILNCVHGLLVELPFYAVVINHIPGIGPIPPLLTRLAADLFVFSLFIFDPLAQYLYARFFYPGQEGKALDKLARNYLSFYLVCVPGWVTAFGLSIYFNFLNHPSLNLLCIELGFLYWTILFDMNLHPDSRQLIATLRRIPVVKYGAPLLEWLQTGIEHPASKYYWRYLFFGVYTWGNAFWIYRFTHNPDIVLAGVVLIVVLRVAWEFFKALFPDFNKKKPARVRPTERAPSILSTKSVSSPRGFSSSAFNSNRSVKMTRAPLTRHMTIAEWYRRERWGRAHGILWDLLPPLSEYVGLNTDIFSSYVDNRGDLLVERFLQDHRLFLSANVWPPPASSYEEAVRRVLPANELFELRTNAQEPPSFELRNRRGILGTLSEGEEWTTFFNRLSHFLTEKRPKVLEEARFAAKIFIAHSVLKLHHSNAALRAA